MPGPPPRSPFPPKAMHFSIDHVTDSNGSERMMIGKIGDFIYTSFRLPISPFPFNGTAGAIIFVRVSLFPHIQLLTQKLPTEPSCTSYKSDCLMPPVLDDNPPSAEEGSLQALAQAFLMIIFSEIGDKTFLIAAILAMRHPRLVVFAGAFASLIVMSILSSALGHILPSLIPRKWTQAAAGALFLVFGGRMVMEARRMKGGSEKIQEEMKEAEEEIEDDDRDVGEAQQSPLPTEEISMKNLEEGKSAVEDASHEIGTAGMKQPKSTFSEGLRNFCSFFLGPVFVQAFILTFLGEWGDRSQIATIALGAAHVSSVPLVL